MADSMLGAWWDRVWGRLRPRACPYSLAWALDMPGRHLVAGPRRVLEAFGVALGQTVLELGPGTGFYSVEAARRVGPSGLLICLDLQREMLLHARSRVAASGICATFLQGDARALPLHSASVDHVFLVTVLGEIPDLASALAEIRRVLRIGGTLSVSEQFPDPDFVTPRALRRELTAAEFVEKETRGWLFYTSSWSRVS